VSGWDAATIKTRLGDALGTSWDAVEAALAAYAAEPVASGIVPLERVLPSPWSYMPFMVGGERLSVIGTYSGDRSQVVVCVRDRQGPARGALLFGGDDDEAPTCALFAEHFPGRPYRGETHGLIFSPQEAKLYAYQREILVALHAEGFWPSSSYASEDGRTLQFAVRKELLPEAPAVLVEFDE
jgi:hypothetical protein